MSSRYRSPNKNNLTPITPRQVRGFLLTTADRCYDYSTDLIPISLDQLEAFLANAKGDSNLQEKLKAAKSPEDVVGIAKEHGHEFTADKLNQLRGEELERLAGGWDCCLTEVAPSFVRTRK